MSLFRLGWNAKIFFLQKNIFIIARLADMLCNRTPDFPNEKIRGDFQRNRKSGSMSTWIVKRTDREWKRYDTIRENTSGLTKNKQGRKIILSTARLFYMTDMERRFFGRRREWRKNEFELSVFA